MPLRAAARRGFSFSRGEIKSSAEKTWKFRSPDAAAVGRAGASCDVEPTRRGLINDGSFKGHA
jgi:hypothetical protein